MLSPLSPTCILFKLKMSSIKTPTKKSANLKVADVSKTPNTMAENPVPPPLKRKKTLIPKSMLRDENVSYVGYGPNDGVGPRGKNSSPVQERQSTRSPLTVPNTGFGPMLRDEDTQTMEDPCQIRPVEGGSNVTNEMFVSTTLDKVAELEAMQEATKALETDLALDLVNGTCNICQQTLGNAQHYDCSPPTPHLERDLSEGIINRSRSPTLANINEAVEDDTDPGGLKALAQQYKEERLKKKFTVADNTVGGRKGVNKLTGANSNKRKADDYRDGALMTRVAKQMTTVAKQQTGKLRKVTLDSLQKRKRYLVKYRNEMVNGPMGFHETVFDPIKKAFSSEQKFIDIKTGPKSFRRDLHTIYPTPDQTVQRLLAFDESVITDAKAQLADMQVQINAVQQEIDRVAGSSSSSTS